MSHCLHVKRRLHLCTFGIPGVTYALVDLLQSAERIGRRATMKLTRDTLYLICARQGPDEVQMWSYVLRLYGRHRLTSFGWKDYPYSARTPLLSRR